MGPLSTFTRQFKYYITRVYGLALHRLSCKTIFPEGSFRTNRTSNRLNLWVRRIGLSLSSGKVVESTPLCSEGKGVNETDVVIGEDLALNSLERQRITSYPKYPLIGTVGRTGELENAGRSTSVAR